MTTTRTRPKVGRRYMELFEQFPIRPIRHEEEYDAAMRVLDGLAAGDEGTLSQDEQDYLGALAMLIGEYDDQHHRIDTSKLTPAELLRFLMEQRGIGFDDLVNLLGGKAAASYLLNGTRHPSRNQCFVLGRYFGVSPGVFLAEGSTSKAS
jgi:HTH-type transcriptional regulator / antitoxin HigA